MKKICEWATLVGIFCAIAVLISSGQGLAAESEFRNIPLPKQFIPAMKAGGTPQYVSNKSIEAEIRKVSPNLKKFFYNHEITQFIVPDEKWLHYLVDSYLFLLLETGIKGQADTWDCENFSSLLNSLSTVTLWQAGYYDTKVAMGWMKVDAKEQWAGLPGVRHALMFAVTITGLIVIEPQNGRYVKLSDYPNRQYIEEVYLF